MNFSVPLEAEGGVPLKPSMSADTPTALLIVSANEQCHVFVHHLQARTKWALCSQFSFADAVSVLQDQEFSVVLCDSTLTDGDWRSLLELSERCVRPPRFVVFSRLADVALWAEALNLGAYDLLVFPFDPVELTRVVTLASESWAREGIHSGGSSQTGRADLSPARMPVTRAKAASAALHNTNAR